MKKIHVQSKINGENIEFLCEPRQSLLEVLREDLGFTGSKEGCNDGNCGACSVIMNGTLVDSCLVLAVEIQGKEITTVEGLATVDGLHPLQQKFLENASLQCGICTPGFLVAANRPGMYQAFFNTTGIEHCNSVIMYKNIFPDSLP